MTTNAPLVERLRLAYYRWFPPSVSHRVPSPGARVVMLENDTVFRSMADIRALGVGSVFASYWDLEGAILDGSRQTGDGSQDENQEQLFHSYIEGLTIANGFIRNNKDALRVIARNNTFYNITFLNVGEDAIATSPGSDGLTISNCEFINWGGDKSLQLSTAKDVTVKKCLFVGNITAIRWGTVETQPSLGLAEDNKYIAVETAHNFDGTGAIVLRNESYRGMKLLRVWGNGKFIVS